MDATGSNGVLVSQIVPTYEACFNEHATKLGDFIISEKSFVAFKVATAALNEMVNPTMAITVHVCSTNMLGNTVGCLGLFEMSDSVWNLSDSYESVKQKVSDSPMTYSNPVSDVECNGIADSPDITFTVPTSVVSRWRRGHMSQVSLVVAPYGTFEYDGFMTVGSNRSGQPVEITYTDEGHPIDTPVDITVDVSTMIPTSRVTITAVDGTFTTDVSNLVVMFDDEKAIIVSGNEKSIKVVVPELSDKVSGTVGILVSRVDGTALSNTLHVYYDASSRRKNKYFTEPLRSGRVQENVSQSAVYNRDLGFNNFVEITDENSIVQNIYNILLTRKGERLFNGEFGTTIEERVFSIINEDDETNILQECFTAIRKYEPRVSVDYDESKVELDYDGNSIRVIIAVVLPSGNSEYIVLPFKYRGSIIK